MEVFLKLYAEKNLGDDLFLKIVVERYPHIQFFLLAGVEYKLKYKNLKIIEEKKISICQRIINLLILKLSKNIYKKRMVNYISKKYSKLKDADLFVSIGGSIFIQNKIRPCYEQLEVYKYALNYKKKIYILGCNYGPYISNDFKRESHKIFSLAKDVSFRDSWSYSQFDTLRTIRLNSDIVFGMSVPKNICKIEKSIGFVVTKERNGIGRDIYLKSYAKIINFFQEKEYEIFLFSFCKHEGDQKAIEDLVGLLDFKIKKSNKVFYNGDIDSFLSIYSRVEKMFCGRFHSMVLSMLYNQKIYPIIYSDKMINVLKDINYKGSYLKIEDIDKVYVDKLEQDIFRNNYDVSDQISNSFKHFSYLDKELKR